jgi:hypothetical protein
MFVLLWTALRGLPPSAVDDPPGAAGEEVRAGRFWEAEPEDQDYFQRYTDGSNQFSPYRTAAR